MSADRQTPSRPTAGNVARIERLTLGVLLASGLTPTDVAILAHAYRHGSPLASRGLERRLGSAVIHGTPAEITLASRTGPIVHPGMLDGTMLTLHAIVPLAPGVAWSAGTIHTVGATIPQTLAINLPGRPLRVLIVHPDLDPDAVMTEPVAAQGLVSVPMETVDLPLPGRIQMAWRTAVLLQREHAADRRLSREIDYPSKDPYRIGITPLGVAPAIVATLAAIAMPWIAIAAWGRLDPLGPVADLATVCLLLRGVVDALRAYPKSQTVSHLTGTWTARSYHRICEMTFGTPPGYRDTTLTQGYDHSVWLSRRHDERGHDDKFNPIP